MTEDLEVGIQWLAKARSDLLNADNNLKSENIPLDTVCFHCQQAAKEARNCAEQVLTWIQSALPEMF